jgi:hypothetical protein
MGLQAAEKRSVTASMRTTGDTPINPTTREQFRQLMLKLSEVLVSNQDIESFDELIPVIQAIARSGERFFRMDVKPPYPDTPENWEDRLEAAFSGLVR